MAVTSLLGARKFLLPSSMGKELSSRPAPGQGLLDAINDRFRLGRAKRSNPLVSSIQGRVDPVRSFRFNTGNLLQKPEVLPFKEPDVFNFDESTARNQEILKEINDLGRKYHTIPESQIPEEDRQRFDQLQEELNALSRQFQDAGYVADPFTGEFSLRQDDTPQDLGGGGEGTEPIETPQEPVIESPEIQEPEQPDDRGGGGFLPIDDPAAQEVFDNILSMLFERAQSIIGIRDPQQRRAIQESFDDEIKDLKILYLEITGQPFLGG